MIREKLIKAGVKTLTEFGYEYVTEENILTDEVYQMLFANMLKENKRHLPSIDIEISKLLSEIKL